MLKRAGLGARIRAARLAVGLLERTGVYSGYYAPWRWALFEFAQSRGLHILPVHYYTPIPDTSKTALDDGARKFPLDVDADAALAILGGFAERYGHRFEEIAGRRGRPTERFEFGIAPYQTVEAECLYGLIRSGRPQRIVEIGCGHTTLLIAEAIADEQAETGHACDYTCIEPYRPDYLRDLPPQVSRFHDMPLQEVDPRLFEGLGRGDVLFIDSSHVVKYGSDVVLEILDILPRLAPGVLVHFHDIFLPYDYPAEWIADSRFFWSEQYLLYAALRHSDRYRTLLPLHMLCRERRREIEALFPLAATPGMRPSAFWVEVGSPGG